MTGSAIRKSPSAGRPKAVVVTGVASGIGEACAERLRSEGIHVIGVDRDPVADVVVDISDRERLFAAAREIEPVDGLINSAGVLGQSRPFLESTVDDWRHVLDVNVLGTVNMLQAFVPGMVDRGWGRVVNLASIAGKEGSENLTPYAASKGAIITLTKSLARELAITGVLVNAIAPGTIRTAMVDSTPTDVLERRAELIPMKRLGRPDEVAELAAWLVSEKVGFDRCRLRRQRRASDVLIGDRLRRGFSRQHPPHCCSSSSPLDCRFPSTTSSAQRTGSRLAISP